jgi:GGDEF domain-containing protein
VNEIEALVADLIRRLTRTDGVAYIYDALEAIGRHYRLDDAVIRLEGTPGDGLFRLDRAGVDPELARRVPPGQRVLFTEPDIVQKDVAETVLDLCVLALRLRMGRHFRQRDLQTGLLAPQSFNDVLASATAQGARHGWVCTLVVVDIAGSSGQPTLDEIRQFGRALQLSLRSGDVAARVEARRFVALLSNSGLDAVNPLLGRVYGQLGSARSSIRLSVGSAATPTETVDPAELRRLATTRLQPSTDEQPPGPVQLTDSLWDYLELELRLLPPVVHVSRVGRLADREVIGILTGAPNRTIEASARRIADAHGLDVDFEVDVVSAPIALAPEVPGPQVPVRESPEPARLDRPEVDRPGVQRLGSLPGGSRISYKSAVLEGDVAAVVHLAHRDRLGVGRSNAGELRGSAEATMAALIELGLDPPLSLQSVSTAVQALPGSPVRVVLTDGETGAQYVGIARGQTGPEAASRATLSALNGFLDEAAEKLSA